MLAVFVHTQRGSWVCLSVHLSICLCESVQNHPDLVNWNDSMLCPGPMLGNMGVWWVWVCVHWVWVVGEYSRWQCWAMCLRKKTPWIWLQSAVRPLSWAALTPCVMAGAHPPDMHVHLFQVTIHAHHMLSMHCDLPKLFCCSLLQHAIHIRQSDKIG